MMVAGTGSISRLLCQFSQFYCFSSRGGVSGPRTGLLSNTRPYAMILRAAFETASISSRIHIVQLRPVA
jgi:hypothetical protein